MLVVAVLEMIDTQYLDGKLLRVVVDCEEVGRLLIAPRHVEAVYAAVYGHGNAVCDGVRALTAIRDKAQDALTKMEESVNT